MKIRRYLALVLSVFSVLPSLIIMGFSIVYFGSSSAEYMENNMEGTAKLTAENVNQFFFQRKMALEVASDLPDVKMLLLRSNSEKSNFAMEPYRGEVNSILNSMTERQTFPGNGSKNYVRRSALANKNGEIIASDDHSLIGRYLSIKTDMKKIPRNEFYVSNVQQDPEYINGQKYFDIAVPIYQNDSYQGYLLSSIDMYYFDRISEQTIMNKGQSLVVDSNSVIAADDIKDDSGEKLDNLAQIHFDNDFYNKTWRNIDLLSQSAGFLNFSESGHDKLGYYSKITGTNWVVLSIVPRAELMNPLVGVLRYYGAAIFFSMVALAYISYIAAKRFLTPIHDLSDAFMRLKQKDYSVRLPGVYKGEFGDMVSSFNLLVEKIQEDTEELKVSEARYALIMEETNQVIFEWDIAENHLYHTVHWTNKFGFGLAVENPGAQIPKIDPGHPEDRELIEDLFRQALRGVQPKPVDVRMKTIAGQYIWCTVSLKVIFDNEKNPYRAIGLISDTDRKKKMIEKLETKTKMDLLTEIYNKMTTEEMIEDFLCSSPPEEQQHGFIIMDIDNFKGINDTLGHIYGDNVLKTVSAELKKLFRSTDIVGRAGGDEFVILVKDIPNVKMFKEKLSEICKIFHDTYIGEQGEYKISASVGAALFPSDGQTFSELYQHADSALYRSKKSGKDCFSLYCEGSLKHTC